MASENRTARKPIVEALKRLHAIPVENGMLRPGTPDVHYVDGWIETKHIDRWPARATTPVVLDHYTPQQRIWARDHVRAGGRVWLVLKVGRLEWLLFDGIVAADNLNYRTRSELVGLATAHWEKSLDRSELLEIMLRENGIPRP